MMVSVCPDVFGVSSIQSGGTHSFVEPASVDLTRVGALLLVRLGLRLCTNETSYA
jgi:hypothetical protein